MAQTAAGVDPNPLKVKPILNWLNPSFKHCLTQFTVRTFFISCNPSKTFPHQPSHRKKEGSNRMSFRNPNCFRNDIILPTDKQLSTITLPNIERRPTVRHLVPYHDVHSYSLLLLLLLRTANTFHRKPLITSVNHRLSVLSSRKRTNHRCCLKLTAANSGSS